MGSTSRCQPAGAGGSCPRGRGLGTPRPGIRVHESCMAQCLIQGSSSCWGVRQTPTLGRGSPHDPEQALGPALRGLSSFQNKFIVRNAREKVKGSKEKQMEGVGRCSRTGQDSVRIPVAPSAMNSGSLGVPKRSNG